MKNPFSKFNLLFLVLFFAISCKKDPVVIGEIELTGCSIGDIQLVNGVVTTDIPINNSFVLTFSDAVDSTLVKTAIYLKDNSDAMTPAVFFAFADNYRTVIVKHNANLEKLQQYTLVVTTALKGRNKETFSGAEYKFITSSSTFTLNKITINNQNFMLPEKVSNVLVQGSVFYVEFSSPIDTVQVKTKFTIEGSAKFNISVSTDLKSATLVWPEKLAELTKYSFSISSSLKATNGFSFNGFSNTFTTSAKILTDDELLTAVQSQTFKYFYDYAHPTSGMARERFGSDNTVTSGGSGFGVMALIVGMERGFITRSQGITHLTKIITFLENADRFHGAWSHWIDGSTGHVIPFSTKDDGGDLVETAFMAQGLIAMRQYLNPVTPSEASLIARINTLYNGIEWDWYRNSGQNVLYWHWSPNYAWDMNFQLRGYNETLITYIMAASSPTHTITKPVYTEGYARNGGIINGNTFYGYVLPVGYDYGGPLFFAHYSFLGLDPRNLSDAYANYWTQNVNHSLINWKYCETNPKGYPNYSASCWGLTSSDLPSPDWYGASQPTNDKGTIAPTAAVSSLPFTPEQSMAAIRYFYYTVGDRLWGDYGFHDAFDEQEDWWASSYLAIDQGPEVVMIENYRTGLVWNLFMSAPEVKAGLTKLGFSY
ncbi:MAG: glucoamylase family protein [Bacteroidales bacterium]|nr:glucoamylase family protein [Bacteroidales bacterium]